MLTKKSLKDDDENEDERLKAAEQRLIATVSLVNVAERSGGGGYNSKP